MFSFSCMLCKKADREFINICYRNGRNSAKDDILELCGTSVEEYLDTDDLVCSKCMKVLDNAAKLKRQVYEIIIDHGASRQIIGRTPTKSLNLSKVWNVRANNVPHHSSYDDSADSPSPTHLLSSPPNLLTQSPHLLLGSSPHNIHTGSPNLLVVTGSIPFDQRSDTDIEEANNKYRNTPALDREVQQANFRHRRKGRGHNWTRRKGSRSRTTASRHSRYSRSSRTALNSRSSRGTTASRKQQNKKHSAETQLKRILSDFLYQNDSLSQFTRAYVSKYVDSLDDLSGLECDVWSDSNTKPMVKTRFASEIRDRLLAEYEQLIYECPVHSCQETMLSLEEITEHRVKEHNEMALFWCEQCKFSYITQEHLDKHKEKHYKEYLAYCIYCAEEFTNKRLYEQHLDEHLIHSFPCIYCDKFFLKKQLCDNHIRIEHPGRKKKIKLFKRQSILDRIDKNPEETKSLSSPSTSSSQEFVVRVLWNKGPPVDPNTSMEHEDYGDLNLTDMSDVPDSDPDPISPSKS